MDEARGPEDRIEQIVHEAEGGAQFEFNPGAWSAMESKLDAVAHVPFNWWKLLFPVASTVLLLTLLLWPMAASDLIRTENLTFKENPTQKEAAEADKASQNENGLKTATSSDNKLSEQAEVSQDSREAIGTETAQSTSSPQQENENIGVVSNDERAADSSQSTDLNNTNRQSDRNVNQNTTAQIAKAEIARAIKQGIADSTIQLNQAAVERFRAAVEDSKATADNADGESTISYFSLAEVDETNLKGEIAELFVRYQSDLILPEPDLEFPIDSALYSEKSSEIQYFNKSRWAFSVGVSADLSATGLEGFTDPGTMVGFGVEYYVNNSWSIQTGATLAVKKYTALGSEYATPDWISARPDDLLSASAVCTVIDIPLNIRKYFQNRKGNTFFVSTGVSTYLMLREDYNYEYTEERPGWLPFWSIRNQNNHFFGILNLSVGYEKPLGKNLALGIEPFMKLPLTGIGEGRVRFLSFGTNIAIKLRK